MHADAALAQRLEAVDALNTADYATTMARLYPASGAGALALAGGQAVITGPRFPINFAVGLGMNGPVDDAELDALEAFFARAELPAAVELCPLADRSLVEALGRRGYRLSDFMNICVRPLHASDAYASPPPSLTITAVAPAEVDLWARDPGLPDQAPDDHWLMLNTVAYHRPGVTCYLAWIGGQIAGKGALSLREGVATLFSAHTQPAFRRCGVQAALIGHRLAVARAAGCDVALVHATPGSASQRNLERAGFHVAYTHVVLTA
jgi:GNAT superfamily N-acetyltransferase